MTTCKIAAEFIQSTNFNQGFKKTEIGFLEDFYCFLEKKNKPFVRLINWKNFSKNYFLVWTEKFGFFNSF